MPKSWAMPRPPRAWASTSALLVSPPSQNPYPADGHKALPLKRCTKGSASKSCSKQREARECAHKTNGKKAALSPSLLLHSSLALLLQFCFVNVIAPSSTNRLFVLFLLYNLHQRVPWGCYAHICTNTRTQQTAHIHTHTYRRARC